MLERCFGVEYWSGVESDFGVTNGGHITGITEHNTTGKIDCSFDPGHMSRYA